MVMSPFSLSSVGLMLMVAANGETRKTLQDTFRFDSSLKETKYLSGYQELIQSFKDRQDVILKTANRMFVMEGFPLLKSFKAKMAKHLKSKVSNINFGKATKAANIINSWVLENTDDKIENLITSDDLRELIKWKKISVFNKHNI